MVKVKRIDPNNLQSALVSLQVNVIDPAKIKPVFADFKWSISKTHPDMLIPPFAAEGFASFPEDVRAILRPAHDAKLMTIDKFTAPCSDAKSQTNGSVALEIGKLAIRALEYDRGLCWLSRAEELHNPGAAPLLGVANLEGWGIPKNPAEAFRTFSVRNDAWSVYFREQCYLKGIGTAQNPEEAKKLDTRLQVSLFGEYLLESIRPRQD